MSQKTPTLSVIFALCSSVVLLFLICPLLAMVFSVRPVSLWGTIGDTEVLKALGLSVLSASIASGIAVLFGTPFAFLLARRRFPLKGIVDAMVDLPLVVPHPVAGIALLTLFARRRLIGAFLEGTLGVEIVGALPGIVICMLFVSSSFLIKGARDAFERVDPRLENAGRSLGASEARVFFTISLPLALRGILTGAILSWARGISEFGSIMILAYFPKTAPVLIWDRFTSYGLVNALPVAVLLFLLCLCIFFLLEYLSRERSHAS